MLRQRFDALSAGLEASAKEVGAPGRDGAPRRPMAPCASCSWRGRARRRANSQRSASSPSTTACTAPPLRHGAVRSAAAVSPSLRERLQLEALVSALASEFADINGARMWMERHRIPECPKCFGARVVAARALPLTSRVPPPSRLQVWAATRAKVRRRRARRTAPTAAVRARRTGRRSASSAWALVRCAATVAAACVRVAEAVAWWLAGGLTAKGVPCNSSQEGYSQACPACDGYGYL
jgi:hypothetical protein